MNNNIYDVIVVGGGIAGINSALKVIQEQEGSFIRRAQLLGRTHFNSINYNMKWEQHDLAININC